MGFKTVLCLTGADHSDQDVTTAAGLCAEIGAYLSVLIMPLRRSLCRIGGSRMVSPSGR